MVHGVGRISSLLGVQRKDVFQVLMDARNSWIFLGVLSQNNVFLLSGDHSFCRENLTSRKLGIIISKKEISS